MEPQGQDQKDEGLKPCPFCGANIKIERYPGSAYVRIKGHHKACLMYGCTYDSSAKGCQTFSNDLGAFKRKWNVRDTE